MNELEREAARQIAMLDQLEAFLLNMAGKHPSMRRAILARLTRLRRLRSVWIAATASKPNEVNS